MLQRELSLYSNDFLTILPIQEILLVSSLKYNDETWQGIPVFGEGILALEIETDDTSKPMDIMYRRRVFHHELFHMFAYGFTNGQNAFKYQLKYKTFLFNWKNLNPPIFQYSTNPIVRLNEKKLHGFVNDYCYTSIDEDMAEVFSYMMSFPGCNKWMENDKIVEEKVNLMSMFLQEYFFVDYQKCLG